MRLQARHGKYLEEIIDGSSHHMISIGKVKARMLERRHYVPEQFFQPQAQLCCFVRRICGRISHHDSVKAFLSCPISLGENGTKASNAADAIQKSPKESFERNAKRFRFSDGRRPASFLPGFRKQRGTYLDLLLIQG